MKYVLTFLLSLIILPMAYAQQPPLYQQIYQAYDDYRESSISHRRFKHSDIEPLLLDLREKDGFAVRQLGTSIEGRPIYSVSVGTGKTQVLMWSQMHGDEPTATLAGLDLFNFLAADDTFKKTRKKILRKVTLHFVPMLNPDGAEVYERRNALDIDINRDALRLSSPESRILKNIRDSLNADFGFNLHDQSVYYTAGIKNKPATVSFLPPAYNYDKDVNPVRERAMQMIVLLNEALQAYIPGQVARYNDDFEPRAFGDNIQKWGTSTILIESGGYPNDPEKQEIRKLNFMILVTALNAIAQAEYKKYERKDYWSIPENERYLYDLIVRNLNRELNGSLYPLDVGINRIEIEFDENRDYFYVSSIRELGDMSTYYGYDEFDADGMTAVPGKIYPEIQPDLAAVHTLDHKVLLRQGYTTIRVEDMEGQEKIRKQLILDVVGTEAEPEHSLELGNRANFILRREGQARYAVVNGILVDL